MPSPQIAESTSDELARQDGRLVRLEESRDLQLPFLLPEDGYSSDIVRGIPNGQSGAVDGGAGESVLGWGWRGRGVCSWVVLG